MFSHYLFLGGSGLVGSSLINRLLPKATITVADIRPPSRILGDNVAFVQVDLTQPGELERLIQTLKPDVIVNTVNIATIFSEQLEGDGYRRLVRWYVRLYHALAQIKKKVTYVQVGTTGSGGLGFNIPFTHGGNLEDLPIIHKAAAAGVGTGLLLMLSRSFGDRVRVAEVKPGLAIFHAEPKIIEGEGCHAAVLDGGESGDYTYQEAALLTSFMGFTTADEVANRLVRVLEHRRTLARIVPYDLTAAINATVIAPSESDDRRKRKVFTQLKKYTRPDSIVATGNLGPPAITRDLILAHLALFPDGNSSLDDRLVSDAAVSATLRFIQQAKPELADYLTVALTTERFEEVQKKMTPRMKEPWQVVVTML